MNKEEVNVALLTQSLFLYASILLPLPWKRLANWTSLFLTNTWPLWNMPCGVYKLCLIVDISYDIQGCGGISYIMVIENM